MSLTPTIDGFWQVQTSWASSHGVATSRSGGDPDSWARGLGQQVTIRRGPTPASSWMVKVRASSWELLGGLMQAAGLTLARSLDSEVGALGLSAWRMWPVATGRSRAMLAVVLRPVGLSLVASLISRAPYTTSLPAWRDVTQSIGRIAAATAVTFERGYHA